MHTMIPFTAVNEIRNIDQVLERLFGRNESVSSAQPTHNSIPIDVMEADNKFIVRAAVLGIPADQIHITVENNILTIKGDSPSPVSEGTKVYRRENEDGSFARSLRLPSNLNLDAVDASFKNGYVTISIPRIVEETLRIEVKTAE